MDGVFKCVLVAITLSTDVAMVRSSSVGAGGSAIPRLSILVAVSFALGPGESAIKASSVPCVPPGEGDPERS